MARQLPIDHRPTSEFAARLTSMARKPVVLIVRDSTEWKSDEFVTLFREEGYDTQDVNGETFSTAMDQRESFGVIGIVS